MPVSLLPGRRRAGPLPPVHERPPPESTPGSNISGRAQGGQVVTTDGPYAETKEQLGGFWVIQAPDLDAALALAAKGSEACRLPVEVRPFQENPGD